MPVYMCQWKLTRELLRDPELDFVEAAARVETLAEQMGGKLLGYYMSMGEQDGVTIVEAPSGEVMLSALAASMRGERIEMADLKTTRLFTPEEATRAWKRVAGM